MTKITIIAAVAALACTAGLARAQDYPNAPIHLISGFPAGSTADISARVVGAKMSQILGQQIVIENKLGAGSSIAAAQAARAPKDGYTLFVGSAANVINAAMTSNLNFDFYKDFAPIALITSTPTVLVVSPELGIKSVKELIAYAKANPGKLSFSSTGVGTTQHLTGVLLQSKAGIELNHISYRGATQAVQDVLGGRVDVLIETLTQTTPLISSGQMRGLAVTTAKAWRTQPGIPPLGDTVPGFEVNGWMGVATTHDVPRPITERLTREIGEVLKLPEVRERFEQQGNEVQGSTPDEMRDRVAKELAMWKQVVKDGNIPQQ
jgi:tripartite-type tricarboxylate transporter receptor subunit TctC